MYNKILMTFATVTCISVILCGCTKPNTYNDTIDETTNTYNKEHVTNIYVVEKGASSPYEMGYNGDLTPEMLLDSLSSYLECTISNNKIKREENSISLDFKKDSSPFNQSDEEFSYKVLDSIRETLLQNFGTEMEIYYSVEGNDTMLKFPTKSVSFPADLPYKGSDFYGSETK